ncbi:MAG TPA: prepilin-type N-terminal cleavage/methylation domain-containing protein [Pyrinomonadaceae bacterium]|jgi:type II secretory pathway pseudopilin PulG
MKANINKKPASSDAAKRHKTSGFSMIELVIVLVIIMILSAISLPYIYNYQKRYKSEDQALQVMDFMREANQLALNKRRTMRLEIDLTDNKLLLIDEKGAGASDDTEVKAIPLESTGEVRMDQIPTGVSPPNPPNYNNAVFAADTIGHKRAGTTVTGHSVWAIRFKSDGSVVNAAGTLTSANLYVWAPVAAGNSNPRSLKEVRAITMFGGSGAVRYWKHNGTTFVAY